MQIKIIIIKLLYEQTVSINTTLYIHGVVFTDLSQVVAEYGCCTHNHDRWCGVGTDFDPKLQTWKQHIYSKNILQTRYMCGSYEL